MNLKKILVLFCVCITSIAQAQIFWTEDFQNACASDCPGETYSGPNGDWTVTETGFNGNDANTWYVSGAECGNAAGECGSVCGENDPSMHIGTNASVLGDQGASYLSGGANIFFPETDKRIESPTIDCTGYFDIELEFNYIEGGQDDIDDATLWYFDGTDWSELDALAKTALDCAPQGLWTAFTITLPTSANDNPDVQLGFRWVNNDDLIGDDPSFAVDGMILTAGAIMVEPTASFEEPNAQTCVNTAIDFVDTSVSFSDDGITNWNWDFGNTETSTDQNPTGIVYDTPGFYDVTLIVTDEFGDSEPAVFTIEIIDCVPPVAEFSILDSTFCAGSCINFTDISSGVNISNWTWTFEGADTTSFSGQNPDEVCYPTAGNYTATLEITDEVGTDSFSMNIEVYALPEVMASVSATGICPGDSVLFTGAGADLLEWDNGVIDGVYFTPQLMGPVTYTLTGTDANGCQSTDEVVVEVVECLDPIAAFDVEFQIICEGDCLEIDDQSQYADSLFWNFGAGASPETFIGPNPGTVCFPTEGTYTLELIAVNLLGSDTTTLDVFVMPTPTVNAEPLGPYEVDLGESVALVPSTNPNPFQGTFSWTPAEEVEDPDNLVAVVSPEQDSYYIITITDLNGCTATDTAFVHVNIIPGVGVPTAFSPNNDKDNDTFGPLGEGYEILTFAVYNRYGQVVFETTDPDEYWDGKVDGIEQNPGVFFWYLKYRWFVEDPEGEFAVGDIHEASGQVTLIK